MAEGHVMVNSAIVRMDEDAHISTEVKKDLLQEGEDGGPGLYIVAVTVTIGGDQ